MNEFQWLAVYSAAVLAVSMGGGFLPFLGKVTHGRLQLYLSASAGVMLGASFFHVMPHALIYLGYSEWKFGLWMSVGAVGLFCIERFIAPHSHELDGDACPPAHEHVHSHDHSHAHGHGHGHHGGAPAAPPLAGWMAVVGLTIHTFMNGVGLAGAVKADISHDMLVGPGVAMFLAICLHKPADALAVSMMLARRGVSRNAVMMVQFGFAAMVPAGIAAFHATSGSVSDSMQTELTGAALAFSAGTFLFIALSDLLPEVQFHRHDRIPLFTALVLGVALMGFISYLEQFTGAHDHGGKKEDAHDHGGHDHGHNHDHGHKH